MTFYGSLRGPGRLARLCQVERPPTGSHTSALSVNAFGHAPFSRRRNDSTGPPHPPPLLPSFSLLSTLFRPMQLCTVVVPTPACYCRPRYRVPTAVAHTPVCRTRHYLTRHVPAYTGLSQSVPVQHCKPDVCCLVYLGRGSNTQLQGRPQDCKKDPGRLSYVPPSVSAAPFPHPPHPPPPSRDESTACFHAEKGTNYVYGHTRISPRSARTHPPGDPLLLWVPPRSQACRDTLVIDFC
ncbi:hypothetical protein GQ53DRAFT_175509 [Thozetella sp. PMI_491]|nr:hypothetical protein GQ53DRAFT_175509 [Thozetella sp. PMI_491]